MAHAVPFRAVRRDTRDRRTIAGALVEDGYRCGMPVPLALQPISLLHGWAPIAVQVVAAVVLVLAIGWRSRRWRLLWLPISLIVGVVAAVGTYWYIEWAALAGHPAPPSLWVWITLTGLALGVLVFGWRNTRWWRRGVSVLAVPLCLLCAALAVNLWTGYLPTVQSAFNQLTGRPLPGQTDEASVTAMRRQGTKPVEGTMVSVTIPGDVSKFPHRQEYVYLPPAWYASDPPPKLPVVMMIAAEFSTPADWFYGGDAKKTANEFAAKHGGNAPVLVFVDASGSFSNDTECVNGIRGNAADHLTKDVVPYVISHFGVSSDPANWGVAGWSMGGTCAVTLTVKHPELFTAFVDIDGDLFPNAGVKEQTIARLFGGDAGAFASFDPTTLIPQHGPYSGLAGWFAVFSDLPTVHRDATLDPGAALGPPPDPRQSAASANYLCELASTYGIECSVVANPTKHDFPSAARLFADALPWLAGKLGTPGVPQIPLPGAGTAPQQQAPGR
jgi:S-formylglutathione hydrolase FrmB